MKDGIMSESRNRFYHGYCKNTGNLRSNVQYFIIETVKNTPDYEGGSIVETVNKMEDFYFDEERVGEPYYAVYATLKAGFNKPSILISTFTSLDRAIDLVQNITGNYMIETEQPVYRIPDENEE